MAVKKVKLETPVSNVVELEALEGFNDIIAELGKPAAERTAPILFARFLKGRRLSPQAAFTVFSKIESAVMRKNTAMSLAMVASMGLAAYDEVVAKAVDITKPASIGTPSTTVATAMITAILKDGVDLPKAIAAGNTAAKPRDAIEASKSAAKSGNLQYKKVDWALVEPDLKAREKAKAAVATLSKYGTA